MSKKQGADRRVDCDEMGVTTTLSPKYEQSKKDTRLCQTATKFWHRVYQPCGKCEKKALKTPFEYTRTMGKITTLPRIGARTACHHTSFHKSWEMKRWTQSAQC